MVTEKKQFPIFLGVGGVCYLLNLLILFSLSDFLHIHYLAAAFLAFLLVNMVGYQLNRKYTFHEVDSSFLKGLWKYNTVMLSSCVVVLLFMYLMVDYFHVWYLLANIFITAVVTCYNFLLHKRWTFK